MSDFKDFFDEMIDDEPEADGMALFEETDEDEDEEEDEFAEVRTAVLTKNGMLALLTLKTTPSASQIVRFDPREPAPTAQRYDDSEAATKWFKRSLSTSRKNGWNVVYDGAPLVG